jgi:hypothetical protein
LESRRSSSRSRPEGVRSVAMMLRSGVVCCDPWSQKARRAAQRWAALRRKNVPQRPTLPHPGECSTIGAERLSFRVRNGTGRFPLAMAAETLWRYSFGFPTVSREPHSGRVAMKIKSSYRSISTGQLQESLVLSSTSGLSTQCSAGDLSGRTPWKPHLETGFPLRCFQRLSLPNVANQPCSWRNNWHTRGWSTPVLSY